MIDPRPHGENALGDAARGHHVLKPPAEVTSPDAGRQYQLIHSFSPGGHLSLGARAARRTIRAAEAAAG